MENNSTIESIQLLQDPFFCVGLPSSQGGLLEHLLFCTMVFPAGNSPSQDKNIMIFSWFSKSNPSFMKNFPRFSGYPLIVPWFSGYPMIFLQLKLRFFQGFHRIPCPFSSQALRHHRQRPLERRRWQRRWQRRRRRQRRGEAAGDEEPRGRGEAHRGGAQGTCKVGPPRYGDGGWK